jgi:hypothetical protein
MPLAHSSLSRACRAVADFLATGLNASSQSIQVTLGSPKVASDVQGDAGHRLNLFFYRFEPAGVGPFPAPGAPWPLRLHCLITAFAVEEDNVSTGEADLRLLGEVLRLFHERPVLDPVGVNGMSVRLHAVFETLGLDDLNHLWSTQGGATLRPSLAYELSLAPILPAKRAIPAPLTGRLGLGVASFGAPPPDPRPEAPSVTSVEVDPHRPDWTPQIAFVAGGRLHHTLALPVDDPQLQNLRVWIAGTPGEQVTLRWGTWTAAEGWKPGPTATAPVGGTVIDPDAVAAAPTTAVTPPFVDRAGQAALHAERTWTRPQGGQVTLRSNSLLVTLHEEGP